jgi:hypothetical protein
MTKTRATASDFNKGWIQERVHALLEFCPGARDNDEQLCAMVWEAQLKQLEKQPADFLQVYADGKMAAAEAIVRARRIVQRQEPALRGENYETRQKHTGKVREAITGGYDPNTPIEFNPDAEWEHEHRERTFGEEEL